MINDRFKFRAYVKSLNKVFDVVSIDFNTNTIQVIDNDGIVQRGINNQVDLTENEYILLQSTGCYDGRGVLIYEGYIMQLYFHYCDDCYVVKHSSAKFILKPSKSSRYCEFEPRHYKIIGNIYENKGLLEVEND